ncbi:SCAN domain-containing 3-like [Brachionus plicatilis]|uniref:SCAN domain-containing 3-like n=1 Tax=Brachionus plicatilis TaxID=10195 RepID=A0A3M7SXT7_BRAPC|nr:SCAN domain-containing 3-like [Brachionus plicatilis]
MESVHEQEPEKVFRERRGPKRKVGLEEKEDAEEVEVVDPTTKISRIEKNAINIAQIESKCSENLKRNAEKMAQQHVHKLGEAKVGDTVQVPVPDVDRGPADLLNILAYITKINSKNMTYQLATKYGIIAGWHTRNKFHICKQKLLNIESLDLSCEKTLREINSLHSICGGHAMFYAIQSAIKAS